jgi:hypothetical protein
MAKKKRQPIDNENWNRILQALDDHLGFLNTDINVDYPELIRIAGDRLRALEAADVEKINAANENK